MTILFLLLLGSFIYSLTQFRSQAYQYVGVVCAFSILILVVFVQNPIYAVPSAFLTATKFSSEYLVPGEIFPDYVYLEEESAFRVIKDEVTNFLFKSSLHPAFEIKNGYKVLSIKSGKLTNSSIASKLPFLGTFLENHPDIVSCSIRIIKPGASISLTEKNYKGVVKYTLPTHLFNQKPFSFLCVNGKKFEWEEGKGVVWDGNFMNKVYNRSIHQCIILDMDLVRPLSGWMDKINKKVVSRLYRS